MRIPRRIPIIILLILCLAAAACSRSPRSTAKEPRLIPPAYSVAVAPFFQPRLPSQLIMGRIPQDQGIIPPAGLAALDERLHARLGAVRGSRRVIFLSPDDGRLPFLSESSTSGQPEALPLWAACAADCGADFLLVPHAMHWREREGSRAGVTRSAHVRLEIFLIAARTGRVAQRFIHDVEQEGLADNLLTMGDFLRRGAAWITAEELADEGIQKAIKELGL